MDATITWRVHPARQRLAAAAASAAVIAALAALVFLQMRSFPWALLAVVVLVAALRKFFFPTRYQIDAEGISARCLWSRQSLRWTDIRRFLYDARGGCLSARRRPSTFDTRAEIHVQFGANREQVIQRIRSLIDVEPVDLEERASCAG